RGSRARRRQRGDVRTHLRALRYARGLRATHDSRQRTRSRSSPAAPDHRAVVLLSGAHPGPVGPDRQIEYSNDLRGDPMSTELATKAQALIDSTINPAVAGHGGFVQLIDVKDNKVYLQMGGGCQGCGAADITLKAGIERLIKEEIPEVEEVLDTTDHEAGTNPFYAPSK